MNADLSAFYFDIRKDALYCDPPSSAEAARRAGGDRAHFPRRDGLARADPRLHRRRGVGARATRRSRSVHLEQFPGDPGGVAGRCAGAKVGDDPRPAPRCDRRDRDRARRQGDRIVAGGRAARLSHAARAHRGARGASISPRSASPRTSRSRRSAAPPRRRFPPAGAARTSRSSSSGRRASNARAPGAISIRRPPRPIFPTSPRATPRRCANCRALGRLP